MKPTWRPSISLVSETGDVLMNAQSPHKWWPTLKYACVWLEFVIATACYCCCRASACLSEQARSPEEKQTVSRGLLQL